MIKQQKQELQFYACFRVINHLALYGEWERITKKKVVLSLQHHWKPTFI
jgi:hypothetical protein